MKIIIISFFYFIIQISFAQNNLDFHSLFIESIYNENICDSLIKITESKQETIALGYYSAALMIKSKHAFSPIKKYNFFNIGSEKLDDIIEKNPENTILRILRLTIQNSAPFFLNYNQFIELDQKFIFSSEENIKLYEQFFVLDKKNI